VGLSLDHDVRIAHSRDASGLQLIPEGVARAGSIEEVIEMVRAADDARSSITPAGGQTSMTGASITDRGVLLSLVPMSRIVDVDVERRIARVEPGVRIGDLNRAVRESGLMFAPDPTSEEDATVGGAIALNASGARSLHYGATRRHVAGVTVVHADGGIARYDRFRPEKNTVGYAAVQDPVDWFVGSEGTLGVVVEAELSLVEVPASPVGLSIPFASPDDALDFVIDARESAERSARCLEFFDAEALAIAIGSERANGRALVYLEDDAGPADRRDALLEHWLNIAEGHGAATADIDVYEGPQALRKARIMRHSVPATMNERGAAHFPAGGRKVSTDWAVPYRKLREALMESARTVALHGAPSPVTYGHAGNGHPHQNFIATNAQELARIHAAVEDTLKRVVALGGTVSAEHGLGKLKKSWLGMQLAPRQIAVMLAMKNALDPHGVFSPGNVL
jgi:glycolate oxidase